MADAGAKTTTVRIFVSSPGDVQAERERVDRIAQRLNAAFLGAVHIETVRWERSAYTADSTFQRQIVDPGACDLVVSIFWQRLGSELPPDFERMRDGRPYPSGTVYELVKGLQASQQSAGGLPHVFVYRKMADAAVPMTDRERYRQAHEQREAFLAFWEEWFVSEQGHFKSAYNTFNSPDDFEEKFEEHLRAWLRNQGYGVGAHSWPLAERGSPFCSLEPFDAGHEEVFFGREREIDRAIEGLTASENTERRRPFLLLLGESGSGKSSLARAGIVPRILRGALGGEPAAWRAAVFKPGAAADPLAALAEALCAPVALPEILAGDFKSSAMLSAVFRAKVGGAPIVGALDRVAENVRASLGSDQPPRGGLVVLVDQMEELFGPDVNEETREQFAAVLADLLATGRVSVIGTLRSDAYAEFTRSPGLLALKESGATLDVTTPGPAEIADIVRAPAEAAGLSFGAVSDSTNRLDDVVIQAASGRDMLPLLQFTLSRLFDMMRERLLANGRTLATAEAGDLIFTHDDYASFGGLEGAIGERAEETFAGLDKAAQERLPRLLRALAAVDTSDKSQTGTLHLFEVATDSFKSDPAATTLIDALVGARVLVTSREADATGGRHIRLAHEAVLRTWDRAREIVADHADFFRVRADLIAAERRYARARTEKGARSAAAFLLASGVPLAEAQQIRSRFADELPPELTQYIDRSAKAAGARQRWMSAAVVVFGVMAIAASIAAFYAVRSEQAAVKSEQAALRSEQAAARNFTLAVAQADTLVTRISEELKDLAISRDALRRMLNTIERQFSEIAKINPDHPRLLLSRARMLTAFVDNYLDLSETTEALQRAEECVAIARRLVAREPGNSEMKSALGNCLDRQGHTLRDRGRYDDAIATYREAVALRRELITAEADKALWRRDLADALRSLGYALVSAGRNEESLTALDESVKLARALAKDAPDDQTTLRVLTDSLNTNAIVLSQLKRPQDSLANYRESATVARRLIALDASNTTWRRYLSNILANSSAEMVALGQQAEALKSLQESLEIRRGLVTLDPGNMIWQRELSYILVEIGTLYASMQEKEKALLSLREASLIVRRLIEIDPSNVTWKNELRRRLPPVVELLVSLGKQDDAVALVLDAIALFRDSVNANPADTRQKFELGYLVSYYAVLLVERGDYGKAQGANEEALALMRPYLAENPASDEALQNVANTLFNLGRSRVLQKDWTNAASAFEECIALWRRVLVLTPDALQPQLELSEALRHYAASSDIREPFRREALGILRRLQAEGKLPQGYQAAIDELEKDLKG
ncbi:photosystem I assembly protein Ycf3 [Variibacter gotjawalensis]|uniref:Photosystem I assembly protein Ycf3 n=1 Tax=Variibacter gotjawalensis TaxID=1333996 RepID=A0A0S3Q0K5_9BRAD|nr:tetratricopeptide repeat protein [Variibacter gotjawalensis]NIK47549.1 tetratricopeptide (TPR) repeat protein [Variibacter gotjawalensis]RZS49446.1 tetratricopeptide repeat protein [Variibacter gotjawalensis]BAT61709.1 photosystem I assembly protein Ycf3 [Variibacter gotjawalensis]